MDADMLDHEQPKYGGSLLESFCLLWSCLISLYFDDFGMMYNVILILLL